MTLLLVYSCLGWMLSRVYALIITHGPDGRSFAIDRAHRWSIGEVLGRPYGTDAMGPE